jgi:four helix bundle protein
MAEGGYRSLRVYRQSHELAVRIHSMTLGLPKLEAFEEGSQVRRSSKRISASIVEGYGLRVYKAEYLHYLYRAYGSAEETVEHLDYLWETGSLTDEATYRGLRQACVELNRQLFRFIQSALQQHDTPISLREEPAEYAIPDESLNPES